MPDDLQFLTMQRDDGDEMTLIRNPQGGYTLSIKHKRTIRPSETVEIPLSDTAATRIRRFLTLTLPDEERVDRAAYTMLGISRTAWDALDNTQRERMRILAANVLTAADSKETADR